MPICSFCKIDYKWPRGLSVVQKDGTVRYYCSSKCRKNFNLGRDSRKVKWVTKNEDVASEAKVMKEE